MCCGGILEGAYGTFLGLPRFHHQESKARCVSLPLGLLLVMLLKTCQMELNVCVKYRQWNGSKHYDAVILMVRIKYQSLGATDQLRSQKFR